MPETNDNTPVGKTLYILGNEKLIGEANLDWQHLAFEAFKEFVIPAKDSGFQYSEEQLWLQRQLEDTDIDIPRRGVFTPLNWLEIGVKATLLSFAYTKGAKMHLSSPEIQRYEESAFSQRGAGGGVLII